MKHRATPVCLLLMTLLIAGGCGSTSQHLSVDTPPRTLPIIDGRSARPEGFATVVASLAEAEVIVVGEEHDDLLAHRFQVELVRGLHQRCPQLVLALEMVERDQQKPLEDYLKGVIDDQTFVAAVRSGSRGQATFIKHCMPLIRLAKQLGIPVVAANAPRPLVRAARVEGYEHLESMPEETRRLFDIPEQLDSGAYRRRVEELMWNAGSIIDRTRIDAFMRAQELWDQTMAQSVVRAVEAGGDPVVLVVGRFHGDFGGGTINRILQERPAIDLRYIVTIGGPPGRLRLEDADRADHVLYTGKPSS